MQPRRRVKWEQLCLVFFSLTCKSSAGGSLYLATSLGFKGRPCLHPEGYQAQEGEEERVRRGRRDDLQPSGSLPSTLGWEQLPVLIAGWRLAQDVICGVRAQAQVSLVEL